MYALIISQLLLGLKQVNNNILTKLGLVNDGIKVALMK